MDPREETDPLPPANEMRDLRRSALACGLHDDAMRSLGMNRPLLPFLRLVRLARLAPSLGLALTIAGAAAAGAAAGGPPPGAAPAAAAATEATGAARKSAEALFNRYIDLEHAFD